MSISPSATVLVTESRPSGCARCLAKSLVAKKASGSPLPPPAAGVATAFQVQRQPGDSVAELAEPRPVPVTGARSELLSCPLAGAPPAAEGLGAR